MAEEPVRIRVPIDIEIEEEPERGVMAGESGSPSGFQSGRPVSGLPRRHHGHMTRPTYLPEGDESRVPGPRPDAVRIADLKQLVIEILDEPEVRGRLVSGSNQFVSKKGVPRQAATREVKKSEPGRFIEYGGAAPLDFDPTGPPSPAMGRTAPQEPVLGFQEHKTNIRGDVSMKGVISPAFAAMQKAQTKFSMDVKDGLAAFRAAQQLWKRETSAAGVLDQVGKAPFDIGDVPERTTPPVRPHRSTDTGAMGILGGSSYMRRRQQQDAEIDDLRRQVDMLTSAIGGSVEGLRNLQSLMQNPPGFMANQLISVLSKGGPHAAVIGSALVAAISVPKIVQEIITILAQKGLPLNEDWNRRVEDEQNGLFDIPEKKRRLLGRDTYAITQTDSYQPETGATTYNSLENRQETVISKSVGPAEKAVGVLDI